MGAAVTIPASAQVDHSTLAVRSGTWAYGGIAGGSQALFSDASRQSVASIRCIRATRRIAVSVRSVPGTSLSLWTASAQRSLPATYDPATGFVTAELPASDQLLDALSFSRGRFSVTVPGSAPVVLPNWPEPTRAIEDCRN
jgi:hypothetical protein